MRILLFIALWAISFAPSIHAQNAASVWADMEAFVLQKSSEAIPDEEQVLKDYLADLEREQGNIKVVDQEGLIQKLRRSYWENQFIVNHPEEIHQAKDEFRGGNATNRCANGAVANPDLAVTCSLNIVVIIDQSGSISTTE